MAVLQLSESVSFDATDGEGTIIDAARDRLLSLNPVATAMLELCLELETQDEVIAALGQRIDADGETLLAGLGLLTKQLRDNGLLVSPADR